MEKRRRALRLALAAAGLALAGAAGACEPALQGTRLESPRFVPPPETLKVDAHMPVHRHGMNYATEVKPLGPGRSDRLASEYRLSEVNFSKEETARILQHGPWPPRTAPDPGNRVSGKPAAIALGEKLFFEPRLSGTGSVLCATCHAPFKTFQDGRARGFGLEEVDRNTLTLINVRFTRWYGWDGGHDSLWSQSIRPLLDPREMNASAGHVARLVRTLFRSEYEKAFTRRPPADDEEVLVDVGKALAAFQETLVSSRTPFDDFRDSLEQNDLEKMKRYPAAAQRGLKIFAGKGNCGACHFGPHFTNGEFADTGVPFFVAPGRADAGRLEGIKRLKGNPHNLLGRYNDDPSRNNAVGTRHVEAQHRNFGEWRVPGLRNVALTAPYMHNGSLATLRDVVRHYSELNEERLHADGERVLKPLRLTPPEIEDLVAFLESLSPLRDKR